MLMKIRSDIFTHRVRLTEDKIVETERAIHPWLWEPCMADSLKKDPVVGKPRVIVKEGYVSSLPPQTSFTNYKCQLYCQ
jgi:hypothetical protein